MRFLRSRCETVRRTRMLPRMSLPPSNGIGERNQFFSFGTILADPRMNDHKDGQA